MQDDAKRVPDDLNYAVLVAIGAAIVGTMAEGDQIGILIAGACTAAIYMLVYKNLAGDIATAKTAALVLAIVFGFFLVISMQNAQGIYLLLNAVATGCLAICVCATHEPFPTEMKQRLAADSLSVFECSLRPCIYNAVESCHVGGIPRRETGQGP